MDCTSCTRPVGNNEIQSAQENGWPTGEPTCARCDHEARMAYDALSQSDQEIPPADDDGVCPGDAVRVLVSHEHRARVALVPTAIRVARQVVAGKWEPTGHDAIMFAKAVVAMADAWAPA